MKTMRQLSEDLQAAANGDVSEAVSAGLVTRMAEAMLAGPKFNALMGRMMDDEQRALFDSMLTEPLVALLAKALDAAGQTVAGGLLSKAGREMKATARDGMSGE